MRTIVVTVFHLIMIQTGCCLVHNQNEMCHHDHIPLNLAEICFPIRASNIQFVYMTNFNSITCVWKML